METFVSRTGAIRLIAGAWGALRMRTLLRAGGAILMVALAAVGAWFYVSSLGSTAAAPPDLNGTWQLDILNGERVRADSPLALMSQRIALRGGRIRGETVVRATAETPPGTMPFPDESVDRVVASADGSSFRVLWSGTYTVDARNQVTLRIGKAVYFVKLTRAGDTVEFNQDLILTLRGTAVYRRAQSLPPPNRSSSSAS